MSRYIATKVKKLVAERANHCCEYCLAFENLSFIKFQFDHIISLKHGGITDKENLALSCFPCNNAKGTDVGTILSKDEFIRLFNPRKDKWKEHFEIVNFHISPISKIGEATVKVLNLNSIERIEERKSLKELDLFPHPNAMKML